MGKRERASVIEWLKTSGLASLTESLRAAKTDERLDGSGQNLLAIAGNLMSSEVRKDILRRSLRDTGWNLTHTAAALGLAGPGSTIQAIKDLGLTEELEQARARGIVTRAHKPKRKR